MLKYEVFHQDFYKSYMYTETDYPPKADAGSDVVIHLPQDSVILYGNSSTDDKGIKSYEWIKSAEDKLTADMTVFSFISLIIINII